MDINNTKSAAVGVHSENCDQEMYKLPDPLTRLQGPSTSSSDQDDTQIRKSFGETVKEKYQKTREEKQASFKDFEIIRTPGWIQLQGKLVHVSEGKIEFRVPVMNAILNYEFEKPLKKDFFLHVKNMFELKKKDDIAVMKLTEMYYYWNWLADYNPTLNTADVLDKTVKECKNIINKLDSYQLKNASTVKARVYIDMYDYYIVKSKLGKATLVIEAAFSCIQNHAPNKWTIGVWKRKGEMYNILAHIRPAERREYQHLALQCFAMVMEHELFHNAEAQSSLCYLLEMVKIKLDVPIMCSEAYFDSEKVYQRLIECNISQCEVNEASNLLTYVKTQVVALPAAERNRFMHMILMYQTCICIRLTQICIAAQEYVLAKVFVEKALDSSSQWSWIDGYGYEGEVYGKFTEQIGPMDRILDELGPKVSLGLHTLDICTMDTEDVTSSDNTSSASTD